MKFERTKEKDVDTRDAESYRKFLAGNKTLYTQAFWENGPRSKTTQTEENAPYIVLPGVQDARN